MHKTEFHLNIVIFSDLDGTLLDSATYRWDEAKEALNLCKKLNIPIVLVSSKTRAEIEIIREEMGLNSPFISENGGAIFFDSKKIELGTPYKKLTEALKKIRDKLGWNIKGFSNMSVEEIAYLTGLDTSTAYLASLREYDEPFLILDDVEDISPLFKLAEDMGLKVFKGGRFYHIQGNNDKGKAVDLLISCYKKNINDIITIALGDSPNDFPMLEKVNYPILILSDRRYQLQIPRLRVSRYPGPRGWNEEIIFIIKELVHRRRV